jgi:hypothetical protein
MCLWRIFAFGVYMRLTYMRFGRVCVFDVYGFMTYMCFWRVCTGVVYVFLTYMIFWSVRVFEVYVLSKYMCFWRKCSFDMFVLWTFVVFGSRARDRSCPQESRRRTRPSLSPNSITSPGNRLFVSWLAEFAVQICQLWTPVRIRERVGDGHDHSARQIRLPHPETDYF